MVRLLPLFIAGILLLIAIIALVVAGLGLDYWLGVASTFSIKGNVTAYLTPASWGWIAIKSQIAGIVLLGLSLLVIWQRLALEREFQMIAADASLAWQATRTWIRSTQEEDGRTAWLILFVITLVGAAIRFQYLGQPMRTDEALTYLLYVKRPLYFIVSIYNNVGNHVFATVLSHWSWQLLGNAEWVIRLPVYIAGCLLPPLLFVAVRLSHGRDVALITAALAAGSTQLIGYSANARGYEVLALLIACLMILRPILACHHNRFVWLLWAIGAALSFWTNPAAVLSFGVLALWLLGDIVQRPTETRRQGLTLFAVMTGLGALLTVLLYLPILMTFGIGHLGTMIDQGLAHSQFGPIGQRLVQLWGAFTDSLPPVLAWLAGLAFLLGFACEAIRGRGSLPLALIVWISAYLAVFPVFGFLRLWVPLSLYFYLLTAIGLMWAIKRAAQNTELGLAVALLLAFVGAGREFTLNLVGHEPDGSFFESAEAAEYMVSHLALGDRIYAPCPAGMPLLYAFERRGAAATLTLMNTPETLGYTVELIGLDNQPPKADNTLYVVLTSTNNLVDQELAKFLPADIRARVDISLVKSYPSSHIYRLAMPISFKRS